MKLYIPGIKTFILGRYASLEAILGQIYLTILVARLVGMHLVHQQEKEE